MKALVLAPFADLAEGVDRSVGDEFEATEERIEEINAAGFGQLVEGVADAPAKPARKAARKAAGKAE